MLTVMVVSSDSELADAVERLLEGGGFELGDRVAPEMIETRGISDRAAAAVVIGPLRSRDGSDIRRAREALGEMRLVACAPPADARSLRWAVDNGADGVVWDIRIDQALVPTLQCVCAGQLVVPRGARRQLQPPELTTREKQVLSLVVMGLSNGEIAGKLFLTESTVKSHLGTAFRKLGVRSRAEAARLVADPEHGFGMGILKITGPALAEQPGQDS
jgi:DNA-binding NarL/FixJ family response regulator